MKERRTLLISTPYFPPKGGGLEKYAFEIGTRLQNKYDWRIVVVTSGGEGNVKEEINGLTIYRLKQQFRVSNTPFSFNWFFQIRNILKTEKPDLINIHMPVPGIGDITSLLSRKKPLFITYHSGTMRKGKLFSDILVWLYESTALKILLRRADKIISSSDSVRFGFLKKYKYKSITIRPAVDTSIFKPNTEKKTSFPSILFVAGLGRGEQHKGLKTLIDSMIQLQKMIPEIQLVVVGDGDMKHEYMEKVKNLGLEKSIKFTGRLDGENLVNEYQKAHVFVLTSSNESFSMVVLEAMACGLPVVATSVGGIPDLVNDSKTGFLIEPNQADKLSEKISELVKNPESMNMFGQIGRQKVVDEFNWENRAQIYNDIFKTNGINIVQVAAYYPPHTGGLERVAEMCAEELSRKYYSVQVVTSNQGGVKSHLNEKSNLKITAMHSFEFAHTPFSPTLLFHLFKIPHNSIIHLHLSQAYFPEIVMLVSKLRNIPYIVHFHLDVGVSGIFWPIFLLYKKLIWGPLLRGASRVIACGADQPEIISKKYKVNPEKIEIVLNAVGESFFSVRTYTPHKDEFKLLYIGRLASQKKVERIIQAMSLLKIPAHLTIVGDGEDSQKLERLVSELKLSNVSFEGKKNDVEMQKYHRENDAYLISSDKEGLPLSVLEAMASGLPIIGSDVIGTRDLLNGVGILVSEPYSENFAIAIEELWNTPKKLVELSKQSRGKAETYGCSRFISEIESVYKKIR